MSGAHLKTEDLNAMASILLEMSKMYTHLGRLITDYKEAYARVAYLLQEQQKDGDKLRRELDKKEFDKLKEELAIALSKEQMKSEAPAEPTPEGKPEENSKEKPEETKKEEPIDVESEQEPALKRQRREWQDDDVTSRALWQSKSNYHPRRQGQGWLCYRCKESCGKDAKSWEKPIHTFKTSAIANIVGRLQFRAKCDLRGELQGGLEASALRHHKRRKSLQALEDGKIAAVPHEPRRAPAEQEFTTSGTLITDIGEALGDVEAATAVPPAAGLGGSEETKRLPQWSRSL